MGIYRDTEQGLSIDHGFYNEFDDKNLSRKLPINKGTDGPSMSLAHCQQPIPMLMRRPLKG